MRKLIFAAMALVAVSACESGTSPAGPNPDFMPSAALVDGGTRPVLTGVFYFEEPLQVSPPIPGGAAFDDELEPEVRITGPAPYDITSPPPYDMTFPFGKGNGKVKLDGDSYKLNWATGDLDPGDYNVQVLLGDNPIGAVDLMIDGRDVSVLGDGGAVVRTIRLSGNKSGTIPVSFWLGEGADDVAAHINWDCFAGAGALVIDCDATTVPSGGNSAGPIEVYDLGDVGLPPAAKVIIDPNMVAYRKSCLDLEGADLNDPATWPGTGCQEVSVDIKLSHLAALSATPSLTHYPFYVGLDVFEGNTTERALVNPPLTFFLCQAEEVENDLGADVDNLNIARVSGGTTSVLQTGYGTDGFCEQNLAFGPAPADEADSFLGGVLRRVASAATAWVAPTPLHATAVAVSHGGLRAALPGASEFFATLGEPEAETNVSVSQGGSAPISVGISTLVGTEDAATFYDLGGLPNPSAASSNTGLEQNNTSLLFVYEYPAGNRSLVIIHDAPSAEPTGGGQVLFNFTETTGTPAVFSVRDDANGHACGAEAVLPISCWRWNDTNTDGGVLGPLSSSYFKITIDPTFFASGGLSPGEITRWILLTGDLNNPVEIDLNLDEPVTLEFGTLPPA